jgi:hypothetical protein
MGRGLDSQARKEAGTRSTVVLIVIFPLRYCSPVTMARFSFRRVTKLSSFAGFGHDLGENTTALKFLGLSVAQPVLGIEG